MATGLHQVDSPVVDRDGTLFATYSGTRGERSPVSVFRIRPGGFREPFVTGITNATSLALSPDGCLYVSSRHDGAVYRVADDGSFEVLVKELGTACGLAFSQDGTLYVGDRSGTVFRIATSGRATPFATLPASVAAFHLAWGPDDGLYVSVPTLSTCDCVYRIDRAGNVEPVPAAFGRPQGLAFDAGGVLHVVDRACRRERSLPNERRRDAHPRAGRAESDRRDVRWGRWAGGGVERHRVQLRPWRWRTGTIREAPVVSVRDSMSRLGFRRWGLTAPCRTTGSMCAGLAFTT